MICARMSSVLKKIVLLLGICGLLFVWLYLHRPLAKDLFANAAGASLQITDRHGIVLRESLSAEGGKRTWLSYAEIPAVVKQAVLAAEDQRFFAHRGVDWLSLGRAIVQNLKARRVVSGASTITQQLVKNRFGYPRTVLGKLQEMATALRLEHTLSKEDILTQYLNRVGFANQTFGIEAAARLYFGKPAQHLSLAESVFLVGLIQAPSYFNPYSHRDRALQRQRYLLEQMYRRKAIDETSYRIARREELRLTPKEMNFKAPHFCEAILSGNTLPNVVKTTLDYYLQQKIEEIVTTRLAELQAYHVTNAAVLVVNNRSGEILAYLGSRDFFDETIAGQVNGVVALRQPGSTLKPFTYQLALERSYTPATLIPDIQDYPAAARSFLPENYDKKFHGPVRLRQALACSYNIPAFRVLERLGVEALYTRLHEFGFVSLQQAPSFYGPALTLGDGEVTLLELTGAYSILARRGQGFQLRYVLDSFPDSNPQPDIQLFSPQVAYLITHILADREAAMPAFGEDTPLELPFPTAVKTGTSKDYRDNWTIGFTAEYTVGVWVGNFDGTPMRQVSGISGAAPIYRDIMLYLYRYAEPPSLLAEPPPGLVTARICPLSGALVNNDCPHSIAELFSKGTEPTERCQMHRADWVNADTGLLTEPAAPNAVKKVFTRFPPLYQTWAREMGYPAPPAQDSLVGGGQGAVAQDSPFGGGQGEVTQNSAVSGGKGEVAQNSPFGGGKGEVTQDSPFGGGKGEVAPISIVHPNDGDVYAVDPVLRPEYQTVRLSAIAPPEISHLTWYVDDAPWESVASPFQTAWPISPGTHRIYAEGEQNGKTVRSQEIIVYVVK